MKILLSPSKSQDFDSKSNLIKKTSPIFSSETNKLVSYMHTYTKDDLMKMMNISERLAELNVDRYTNWAAAKQKQAISAFTGDVYSVFQNNTLSNSTITYLEEHLRIISGLYGLLSPLTLIKPYRLEMGRKVFTSADKSNSIRLYDFWGDLVTSHLANDDVILNLASNEYCKVINTSLLKGKFITIVFKTRKNGAVKIIPIFAKKERGVMALWIAENNIKNVEKIKEYNKNGYQFSKADSSELAWIFVN